MKELLDKLSSYNIFNYLFPGILFVVFAERFTSYIFIRDNVVEGIITFYFIGLVISRIGSLIIEPLLKKVKFIKYSAYSNYLNASKIDEKIILLSEQNNMFRTLLAALFLLLILKGYEFLSTKLLFLNSLNFFILIILLMIIFLFSYKKQVKYLSERIKKEVEKNEHN